MGITRAQIARQLLAEGGVSLNDAKMMAPEGEFLAYINPKEANMLKQAGGSGIMTPMGIPSFVEYGDGPGGYADAATTSAAAAGGEYGGGSPDDTFGGGASPNIVDEVALTKPKRSFFQTIADSIRGIGRGISKYSPSGIITRGLGGLFNRLANLRGFNPDGTRRTQAQFERARDIRRAEKSIANIMGRDAPFTDLTLDRLADLYSVLGQNVPGNINESLIGSTNITRSATPDDVFPDRVEGIVSKAPTTFRNAMAQLNLERGVPRDQVFLSAKDFIDPSKTISSEDLGTIQSRMATSAGVPESAIQLTKNYTKEDLEKAGADTGIFGVNDELEALQEYYDAVQKLSGPGSKFAPGNPTRAREFITSQSAMPFGMGSYSIDTDLVPKDFLQTQEDLQQQKSPFELFGK